MKESAMALFKATSKNFCQKNFHFIRFFVATSKRIDISCIHSACNYRNLKNSINVGINKTQYRSFSLKIKNTESVRTEFYSKFNLPDLRHVMSYLDVSVHIGNISQAQKFLFNFIEISNFCQNFYGKDTVSLFNIILNGWAHEGNWTKVSEILDKMEALFIAPNLQSYCAAIESIVRSSSDKSKIELILKTIEKRPDLLLENLLEECSFVSDQKEKVLQGIRLIIPDFIPKRKYKSHVWNAYDSDLLKDLKPTNSQHNYRKHTKPLLSVEELKHLIRLQLERECAIQVNIPSIKKPLKDDFLQWRAIWNNYVDDWRKLLLEAFKNKVSELGKRNNHLSLYPYLTVLSPETYVDVTLQEMQTFLQNSTGRMLKLLQQDIGLRIMKYYFIQKKKKNGILDEIKTLLEKFIHYYDDANISVKYTPREYWELLEESLDKYPIQPEKLWPKEVVQGIGLCMLEILIDKVHICSDPFHSSINLKIPAFRLSFNQKHPRMECAGGIKKLYLAAHVSDSAMLDSTILPMIAPPLPWTSFHNGGFFTSTIPLLRLPRQLADNYQKEIENTSPYSLHGFFDALNKLSSCAWKINEPLLDIAINIFANSGNSDVDILSSELGQMNSNAEKYESLAYIQRTKKSKLSDQRRNIIHYALSIANAFRKHIIWQPHNADFRGRAYPCVGYFKHSGTGTNDVISSLFLFANGEELGSKGIEWLKIHLMNLIGLDKNLSFTQKLEYCDQILDDIIDSASKPLTGKKWWMKSKKPWQTLACCMELSKCLQSTDPCKYVCHLPVHQFGSANILQHYAALTRDEQCAEILNLVPQDKPADVVTEIAEMVELERRKDEANIKIAQKLKGYISRDIVQPIILTTSYNAPNFAACSRIVEYLKTNVDDFPSKLQKDAAGYVTEKASAAVRNLFSSTKELQYWLKKITDIVSDVYQQPIQWVTPLCFPIILPHLDRIYSENMNLELEDYPSLEYKFCIAEDESFPDLSMKSFPPNFLISLEATHVMLSALHCQRQGIEFACDRNCFWTLPSTVDLINQIACEQFVNLHSQPLLDNLLKELTDHCVTSKNDNGLMSLQSELFQELNSPPKKGNFDINKILKSTYFFH